MKGKKTNEIFLLIIFIVIICGLGSLLIKDRFGHSYQTTDDRPNLWIWNPTEYNSTKWSSFYSRSNNTYVPDYIKMCIETVKRHCSAHFNIHILNQTNIKKYLPNCVLKDLSKQNSQFSYDILISSILAKYGGIWMPSSTIVLKNLMPLYSHIVDNGFFLGGFSCDSDEYFCLNSDNPDRAIFIAPRQSPIIHEWRKYLSLLKDNSQNDYTFNKRGLHTLKKVIKKFPSKIHLFDASMNGTRDCRLKLIGADSLLSSNIGSLANPKSLYLLNFDRNTIKNNHRHNWFEKASADDILHSTLWFTLLYRASMGLNIKLDENVVGKSQTRNS